MWFLHFIVVMLTCMVKDKNRSMSSICTEAYDKALGPNHSFSLRTIARVGMLAVPKRDTVMDILLGKNFTNF